MEPFKCGSGKTSGTRDWYFWHIFKWISPLNSERYPFIGNPSRGRKYTRCWENLNTWLLMRFFCNLGWLVQSIHCWAMAIDNGIVVYTELDWPGWLEGTQLSLNIRTSLSFNKQEWIGMQPNVSFLREWKAGLVPLKNQKDTWIFCGFQYFSQYHDGPMWHSWKKIKLSTILITLKNKWTPFWWISASYFFRSIQFNPLPTAPINGLYFDLLIHKIQTTAFKIWKK